MAGSMRFPRLAQMRGRIMRVLRSTEGFRAVVASAGLACLVLVFAAAAGLRAFDKSGRADQAEATEASPKDELWKRGFGSIVFSSPYQSCEEWGFDNGSGHVVSERVVDCEARLGKPVAERPVAPPPAAANTNRMRAVLDGFRK
jgi:hypothetical protein